MPQEVIANGMSDTLGVFVMQHNHTNATHGHIDVGDVISDVFCLKFKRHQRLFNDGHGMCTACRRRSHGPPHQRTDLPPGAPQTIPSTSRGVLGVAITLVRSTSSWHFVTTWVQNLHKCVIQAHKLGGNGSSCGLITRQNAPLAPVSIARHHDTSAQPPEAPPQTHLVALMVRRASAWPAARTRPARTAGWQGKERRRTWTG